MDKKLISFIKRKFPKLFYWVVRSRPMALFVSELDRLRYMYCLAAKKPYFGTVGLAGQTWEERKSSMRQIVKQDIERKKAKSYRILEIGSWAGDSAILWADAIKSSGATGEIICVDPWEPYLKTASQEKVNAASVIMDRALKNNEIFPLFLHNIRSSGNADIIFPVKAFSDHILPLLKDQSFDLVYVDGDHSFSGVQKDLKGVRRLIVDGGILCGDDLDVQSDEVDLNYAQLNKECNMVIDPKTKQVYHPGVCLAVAEFFGSRVSAYNGFWAMQKNGEHWSATIIR